MGQISIYFQNREALKEAIKELQAVLERSKFHYSTDIQPAHFKGVTAYRLRVSTKSVERLSGILVLSMAFYHQGRTH